MCVRELQGSCKLACHSETLLRILGHESALIVLCACVWLRGRAASVPCTTWTSTRIARVRRNHSFLSVCVCVCGHHMFANAGVLHHAAANLSLLKQHEYVNGRECIFATSVIVMQYMYS